MLGGDHSDGSQSDWDDMGATHMVSHGSLGHGSLASSPDAQPSNLEGVADPGPGNHPAQIGITQPRAVTRDIHEKPGLGIDKARSGGPAYECASVLDLGLSTASSFAVSRLPSAQTMTGPGSHAGHALNSAHHNSFQSSAASSTTASGQRPTTPSSNTLVTTQASRFGPAVPGHSLAAAYALAQHHNSRPAHTGLPAVTGSECTRLASTQRSMDMMATGTTAENRHTLSQRVASISAQVAAMSNSDLMDPTSQRRMDLEMLTHGPGVETRAPLNSQGAALGSATATGRAASSLQKRASGLAQHGYHIMDSVEEDEQAPCGSSCDAATRDSASGSDGQMRGRPGRWSRGGEGAEGDPGSSGSSHSHSGGRLGMVRGGSGGLAAPLPQASNAAGPAVAVTRRAGASPAPNPAMYNSLRTSGVWTGSGSSSSGTGGDSNTDSSGGSTAEYQRESTGMENLRTDGNSFIDARLSDAMGKAWGSSGAEARQEWAGSNAGMGAWPDGVGGMGQWPVSMQGTGTTTGSHSVSQPQSDWPGMSRMASDWAGSEDGMSGWPDGHGGATNRPAQSQPEANDGRPLPVYYSLSAQAAAQAAAAEYPTSWRPLPFQTAGSKRMDDIDEGNEFPTLLELSAESMVEAAGQQQTEDTPSDAGTSSRETLASSCAQGSAAAPDGDGPSSLTLPSASAEAQQSQPAVCARAGATVQNPPVSTPAAADGFPLSRTDAEPPQRPPLSPPVAAKPKRQASFNLASSLNQFNAAYRSPAPALHPPAVAQPVTDPPLHIPTPPSLGLPPPPPTALPEAPEPPHGTSMPLPALLAASSVSLSPVDAAAPLQSPPVPAKPKRQASFNLASSLNQFNAAYRPPAPALHPPAAAQPATDPQLHTPTPSSLALRPPPHNASPGAHDPPHTASMPLPVLSFPSPTPNLIGWGIPSRLGPVGLPGLHTVLQARGLGGTPSIGLHSMLEAFTTLRADREVHSADAGWPPGAVGLNGPEHALGSNLHGPQWLVPEGDLHPGLRPGAAGYTMLPTTSSFVGPHMRPLSPLPARLSPAYAPSAAAAVIVGAGPPLPVPELLAPTRESDADRRRDANEGVQAGVSSAALDPPCQHQEALSSPLGGPGSLAWEQQAQGRAVGTISSLGDSVALSSISEPEAAVQENAHNSQQQDWQKQQQQQQQRVDGQATAACAGQGERWGMQPQHVIRADSCGGPSGVDFSDGSSRGQSGYMLQLQGLVEMQGSSSREKSQGSIVCEWPAQSGSRERLGSSRQHSSVRDAGAGGTPGTSGSFTDSGSVRRDGQAESHSRHTGSAEGRGGGEASAQYKSSLSGGGGSGSISNQLGSGYTATLKPEASGCGAGTNARHVCYTGPMNRTDSGIQELAQYLSSNSNTNSTNFQAVEMLGLFKGLNAPTSSTDLPTASSGGPDTAASLDIVAALKALGLDTTSPLALRYIQAAAGHDTVLPKQQTAAVASSASDDLLPVPKPATWSHWLRNLQLAVVSVLRRGSGAQNVTEARAAAAAVAAAMAAVSAPPAPGPVDEPASLHLTPDTASAGPPALARERVPLSVPDRSLGLPRERAGRVSFDSWRTEPSIASTPSQTSIASQQQQPTQQQQRRQQPQELPEPSRQASWDLGSSGLSASNASGSTNNSAGSNLRQRPGSKAVSTSRSLTDSDAAGVAAWQPRDASGMHSEPGTEEQHRLMGTGIERGVLHMCMLTLLMCIGVLFLTIMQ